MGSMDSPGVQEDDLDEMNEAIPTIEDGGSKTRRRALLYTGIVLIILSAIILGSILGTRDNNTSPDTHDSCDSYFRPITRALDVSESTSNGATVNIEAPSCSSASKVTAPGIWFTIIGDGGASDCRLHM
jgi:hypothetical protein